MPQARTFLCAVLLSLAGLPAAAQNTISTVAGTVPNNVSAASAGLDAPTGVAQDAFGNTYISSLTSVIYKVNNGTLTVYTGNGSANYTGDSGPAANATVNQPYQIAVDVAGNIFFADAGSNVIRRIDALTGTITTVAGNGVFGYSGDNGPALSANLASPIGIAVDAKGNLYIADYQNFRIRKVDTSPQHIITTIAGNGTCSYTGDNGPAASATLCYPAALALDSGTNLFIADAANEAIRRINAATGVITTVAGTGAAGYSGDGMAATAATLNFPLGVTLDGSGNLFISDAGNNVVRRVDAVTQTISTLAGNGSFGFGGDNGPATSASLAKPFGIAAGAGGSILIADQDNNRIRAVSFGSPNTVATVVSNGLLGNGGLATNASLYGPRNPALDSAGNLYFADTGNNMIRRVDAVTHLISTVAGTGLPGFSGDNGPAISATMNSPRAVSVDSHGNIYFSDIGNQRIRRVDGTTQVITTVAGNGRYGFTGDGGLAVNARLGNPRGPAVDAFGNLFIPDSDNNRIRRVDAVTGIITTVAGSGPFGGGTGSYTGEGSLATSATLNSPLGVDVDTAGNLYIADTGNSRVRKVAAATGVITSVGGNGTFGYSGDGGPATLAALNSPNRVSANGAGNLFVSDGGNSVIRRIDGLTSLISTFAGDGIYGFSGDGGPATSASLSGPLGVALSNLGNLYIGDTANNRIRLVTLSPAGAFLPNSLSFGNQGVGIASAAQFVLFENSGDGPLALSDSTQFGDYAINASACPAVLSVGSSCNVTVTFTPTTTGPRAGSFTFFDNGTNSPQVLTLNGTGVTGGSAVLPPAGLVFSGQSIGTSSPSQLVNLFNSGNGSLSIASISIGGANASEFSRTHNCPPMLGMGGTCTVQVTFTPLAPGSRVASLVFTDNQGGVVGSQQLVSLAGTGIAQATTPIISVAFNAPNAVFASPLVHGPESSATAANPLFAAANVWNNLNVPWAALVTNPSWSNLVDSTGTPTAASFSITGSVIGFDFYSPTVDPNPLRAEYIGFNSSGVPGESTSINWQITGLVPNGIYDMCAYGARADYVRSFSLTVGNVTQIVPTYIFTTPPPSGCVYFAGVVADANGTISGSGTGIGSPLGFSNEANWSGFQLVQVPTTGTPSAPVQLTFTPGSNVSQAATFNCPSGTVPCTDPNAHSLKLAVPQVFTQFTLTVTAYTVPLSEANGVCEAGQTETTDFDCRFVDYFSIQQLPNGDVIVPQCDAYANGNCVFYRVSNTPPFNYYQGPVTEYIAWNNTAFVPGPMYQANNPRLYDDPDDPPYNINHQFVFDITDYYQPTGEFVGVDAGISGKTLHFNDFVVAFPGVPSTNYKYTWLSPLGPTKMTQVPQGNSIVVKFQISPDTPASTAITAPNRTGYSILLDTANTGCKDFTGVRQPSQPPSGFPSIFTYDPMHHLYQLKLQGIYQPGNYKLLVDSNLFPEQCAVFQVTK